MNEPVSRSAPRAYAPRSLRIERIRLSVLEERLSDPVPMSIGTLGSRHCLLVEVEAGGRWGLGETWVNHPDWACHERLATFRHGIAPLLSDRVVDSPQALIAGLAEELLPRAEQGAVVGPVWQALSGLDLAVWDLLGKLEGRSVAEILNPGRPPVASIAVYASGIGPTRVEELCEVAAGSGVRAVKARVGFGVDADNRTLGAIRSLLGDDVSVFADANRAWSHDEAIEMSAVLAAHGAAWIEEPLHDDSPAAIAAFCKQSGIPVAAGENLYGLAAFENQLAQTPLAVIQPDPAKSGGLTTCAAVADRAAARGIQVYPHCYSGGVALAASVMMAAALDNVSMVEVDVRPSALRTALLDQPWRIRGGEVAVPRGPGLGVVLDEDVRARHLLAMEEIVIGGAR